MRITTVSHKDIVRDKVDKFVNEYMSTSHKYIMPGGTWCSICRKELCRNINHSNKHGLQICIGKSRDIAIYETAKAIFDKFDEYTCITNDKWYKDYKKKEFGL